jgi:GxxExxY protein
MGKPAYESDVLTDRIILCIIRVQQTLGAGFLEGVYRCALLIELREQGLNADAERRIEIFYHGQKVGRHRLDILVEGQVILELKTVEG